MTTTESMQTQEEFELAERATFSHPDDRGHGRLVSWQVHGPDGVLLNGGMRELDDAIKLKRSIPGSWVQVVFSPCSA